MYGADYWKRTDIQHICEFLLSGSGDKEIEKGTPEERHMRYGKMLGENIHIFRDKILAFDWNSVNENEYEKQVKTDEMFEDILMIIGYLNQLAYEVGFVTGVKTGKDIQITWGGFEWMT